MSYSVSDFMALIAEPEAQTALTSMPVFAGDPEIDTAVTLAGGREE
jgi:hypothetical protein